MERDVITIDEDKCNGCGACVPGCPEGALQIIDGKARLVGELLCDGLGACIGTCPQGAITVERRAAEPYNEERVMENLSAQGSATVLAHLRHLQHSNASEFMEGSLKWIDEHDFSGKQDVVAHIASGMLTREPREVHQQHAGHRCPGSAARSIGPSTGRATHADTEGYVPAESAGPQASALSQWPIQMHLINPEAPQFRSSDLLLAADCTAFAMGSFHSQLLKGKALAIACPKLDAQRERYVEKLIQLIDEARVNTISVAMMEVPCCSGLLQMVRIAAEKADRKVPIKKLILGVSGDLLEDEWV